MKTIRQLPTQFSGKGEVKGYEFALCCKTERGFCYEVSISGVITHYEVFRRKINKRFNRVSYPTAKAFGVWAWTCKSLNRAQQKLNSFKR